MAKGEIVETNFPDRFTGPGGRNRIRGGAGDAGSQHDMGAAGNATPPNRAGTHERAGGDAMAGTYGPDRLGDIAGIDLQSRPGRSAVTPEQGQTLDFGNLPTQRTLATDSIGNKRKPGSASQGPSGDFGDKPGDSSKAAPYISGN